MASMINTLPTGRSSASKAADLRNYGASKQEASKNNAYNKPTVTIKQGDNYQKGSTLDDWAYQQRTNAQKPIPPSGGDDKGGNVSSLSDWADQYKSLLDDALNDTISAYDAKIKGIRSTLDEYLRSLGIDEQAAIDDSEVQRYKNRSSLREALANRGQFDGGYGRMEMLNNDIAASKRINDIKNMYAGYRNQANISAQNDINTLEGNKISAKNDFNNAWLQSQLANL